MRVSVSTSSKLSYKFSLSILTQSNQIKLCLYMTGKFLDYISTTQEAVPIGHRDLLLELA